MDETGTLPLFPLANVLFPAMLMPLHIFEPRYRVMVRRCIDREAPFGVVLIREGTETGRARPYDIGTTARIVGSTPLPDGRSFIVARGERRFAIDSLLTDVEPYLVGRVRYLEEDDGAGATAPAAEAAKAYGEYLTAVLAATGDEVGERAMDESAGEAPRDLAYRIAAGLAIGATERQRLLEMTTTGERLTEEIRLLGRETDLLRDLLVRLRAHGESKDLN